MKLPADIRFVGIETSPALDSAVRDKVARLDERFPQAIAWRVTVEQPHRAQRHGREFAVRIDVTMPGEEVTIERVSDPDVYIAVRDAFDAAQRKLQELVRIRRGEVKEHAASEPLPGVAE